MRGQLVSTPPARRLPDRERSTVEPANSRRSWPERRAAKECLYYSVSARSPTTEVSLAGVCENGLKMRRRLWLEGSLLRMQTVLANAGTAPTEAVLQSRIARKAAPAWRSFSSSRNSNLPALNSTPTPISRTASGVSARAGGPAIVNRFAKDQVARCFLNWTAKGENRVGLAVASHRRTLRPGDRLAFDADYGIH
jgi:hypothetical protein